MKYILVLSCVVMLLSSCKKLKDYLDNDHPNPPSGSTCELDSIYPINSGIVGLDRTTAAGVHYNDKGNPIVVNYTFMHYGTYQFPVHYKYDQLNRLIEILPPNDPSIPEYLNGLPYHTKYVYEGNSTVPVRDTVFAYQSVNVIQVEDLYYDAHDRVNRVVYRHPAGSPLADYETKYTYDAQGNKQVTLAYDGSTPTPLVYTEKPSLYSLHQVWKLISKDYSKNTRAGAVEAFTQEGLPYILTRNSTSGYYGYEIHDAASPFTLFLGIESGVELRLTYTCSANSN